MPRVSWFVLPRYLCKIRLLTGHLDYDLCTACLAASHEPSSLSKHSSTHHFFAIDEPGDTWLHTVFTGTGTGRPDLQPRRSPSVGRNALGRRRTSPMRSINPARNLVTDSSSSRRNATSHNATCDLCDSSILGERFVSNIYSFIHSSTLFNSCMHHRNVFLVQVCLGG